MTLALTAPGYLADRKDRGRGWFCNFASVRRANYLACSTTDNAQFRGFRTCRAER